MDHLLDISDIADVVWRVSNNMDAKRDSYLFESEDLNGISHIAIDGTRKTKEHDNFQRDWPNIITMDQATIQAVDEKWDRLGLGPFIPSPSLKYQAQVYNEGAVA